MNTSQKTNALLAAALLTLLVACKDEVANPNNFTVAMTTSNLKRLEPGQGYYQLWISFPEKNSRALGKPGHDDGNFVSFGTFNVSADGAKLECLCGSVKTFEPAKEVNINLAVDAIVTIELDGEPNDQPGSRLLGGVFTGSDRVANAQLSAGAEDIFDFNYSTTSAEFMLATPTTAEANDFRNGIWWIKSGSATIAGIQNLPALADSARWRYEGWVINKTAANPIAYSTGRFRTVAGADHDFAGATAGPGNGFAFPGQDFVRAANNIPGPLQLDIGNFEARLTLEPEPDNSPLPFTLTALSTPVIGPNLDNPNQTVAMQNRVLDTFPAATITINR